MPRKNPYFGGVIGASPLDSNGALRPGVSNLGGISGDNAFEAPSLDLNFDGTASSFTRATTSPTAAKANGDQLATDIVTQNKSGTVQSKYMGPNGKLINGYVTNLVEYSDFTNAAWTAGSAYQVETANGAGPFGGDAAQIDVAGTGDAWLYDDVSATGLVGQTMTYSLFAKSTNSTLTLKLQMIGAASTPAAQLQVNPSTGGSALDTSTNITLSDYGARDIGNGWHRYWMSFEVPSSTTALRPNIVAVQGTTYAYGAQLETTATPSQLVQTSGASVSAQVPRVEFDSSGNALGLLVEEERTNLYAHSEDFLNTSTWAKDPNLVVVADTSITDPTGGTGAFKISEAASGSTTQATLNTPSPYTPQVGDVATLSVFAKSIFGGTNELILTQWGEGYVSFDLSTGTIAYETSGADETGEITPAGNGWYRCSIRITETNSGGGLYHYDYIMAGSGSFTSGSHVWTPSGGKDCFHLFGAQVEVGEGPTSYIPTYGAAATRAADEIALATSAFGYNTAAGTALADFSMQSDTDQGYPGVFTFIDEVATGLPRDILYLASPTDDLNMFSSESSTDTNWTVEAGVSFPLSRSVAVRINGTSGQDAIDGTLSTPQTINVAPSTTRDTLYVGSNGSTNPMNGHIRRFTYWPRAIGDDSLAAYTGTNPPTIDIDRPMRRWGGITGRSLVALVNSAEDWTPADITSANVVGWFDGENVNGGSAGNSGATVWVNKAGGANLSFNNSPTVGTNNVRTASSAYLSEAGTPSFLQTSDWRVFIAATINGGSGTDQYSPLFSSDTGSTNTGAFIYWKTTALEFASYPNNTSAGTSTWWGSIDPIAPAYRSNFQSNPAVIDFKVSNNSPWEIAFDGGRSVSVVSQTITTQIPSNEAAHFGYSYTATRRHDASYYQIVIVHGTLSGDDEARLYSYLAHKAGSQSYLPTSAYSSAAPKRVVPAVPTSGVLTLAEHYQTKL